MPQPTLPIPIEPFEDEPKEMGELRSLGPAGIEECMQVFKMLLNEIPVVFVRNDLDSRSLATPFVPISVKELVRILPMLVDKRPGTTLVSDGNMSHAVSTFEMRDERFIFFDPWNTSSFLQEGANIAGVRARFEGQGRYSITSEEMERVIVAQGITGLTKIKQLITPPRLDEFRKTDFYTFFHLTAQGDRQQITDGFGIRFKTGGFQEFVDLSFELNQDEGLRSGTIDIRRDWLLGQGRPFGMDILKSFLKTSVTRKMNLEQIGVVGECVFDCPDLPLVDELISVIAGFQIGKPPQASAKLDKLTSIINALAGGLEQATLALPFHTISVENRASIVRFQVSRTLH